MFKKSERLQFRVPIGAPQESRRRQSNSTMQADQKKPNKRVARQSHRDPRLYRLTSAAARTGYGGSPAGHGRLRPPPPRRPPPLAVACDELLQVSVLSVGSFASGEVFLRRSEPK